MGRARTVLAAALTSTVLVVPIACSPAPREEPEPHRVVNRSALLAAVHHDLEVMEGHENVTAVVALVSGKPVLEWYDDVPINRHWDIGWGTNLVVTTLIGIALDEGTLAGLDATLRELLPELTGVMSPQVGSVTLRELVTMTAGLHSTVHDPVADLMSAADPVAAILRSARTDSKHRMVYSSQGAHLLAAILARATGMSVLDYARSRLLDPLGIDTSGAYQGSSDVENEEAYEAADFAWPVDSARLNLGWSSLKLTPTDLARIGQLYLDGGRWHGEPLVSSDWVREATAVEAQNLAMTQNEFGGYGYGYGWWIGEADSSPAFFVGDLSGQLLEVVPSHHLVVVVSSQPDYGSTDGGVSPDSSLFLVDDAIAPAVRP